MPSKLTSAIGALTLALAVFALAPPVHAQPLAAKDSGGELGLRLGYGVPMGEASEGNDLDSGISGQIPVILDAGYRFNPNLFLGALFEYGFAQIKNQNNNGCNLSGADCSATVIRLGIDVLYRLMPGQQFAPFVGAGVGYEWFMVDVSATTPIGSANNSYTMRGFEFLNLQAGGDYRLSPTSVIGPFASLSFGQFASVKTSSNIGGVALNSDTDITDTAFHQWLVLGVRGAFSL